MQVSPVEIFCLIFEKIINCKNKKPTTVLRDNFCKLYYLVFDILMCVCVLLLCCDFGVVCECVSQKAERNFLFTFGPVPFYISSFGGKQPILISEAAAGRGRRRRSAPRAPQATPTALRCTRPRPSSSAGSP
jgi:hypothetical protein